MKTVLKLPIALIFSFSFLTLFHSYLYLNSKIILPEVSFFIGSWKEQIFLIILFLYIFSGINLHKIYHFWRFWFLSILLTIYGIILGLFNGWPFFDIIVNARDLMLPIYYFLIISLFPSIKYEYFRIIILIIIIGLIIHGFFGLYDFMTFDGSLDKIWVYNIFSNIDKGVIFAAPNFIRDGNLRAIGLFVSPLEYSMTMLFGLYLITFYLILYSNLIIKIAFIFLLFLFFIFLFVSGVRVWIISYILGVVSVIFIAHIKSLKLRINIIYVISLGAVAITFINLNYDIAFNDLSSLGRLDQYSLVPSLMLQNPLGFGFGEIGAKGIYSADSSILSLLMAFGWIMIIIYLTIIKNIITKLIKSTDIIYHKNSNIHIRVLFFSLVAYSTSLIYTFFFHEIVFYNFLYLFFILIAILINSKNSDDIYEYDKK